jgi:hypothetical protein
MNNFSKGNVRFLVFKKKGESLWTGVCLDFGIVLQGENPECLVAELKEAAKGYLYAAKKEGLGKYILNNQAEEEYFDLFEKLVKSQIDKQEDRVQRAYPSFSVTKISKQELMNHCDYA